MHRFDWQFTAELLMFEKISDELKLYGQNETDNSTIITEYNQRKQSSIR